MKILLVGASGTLGRAIAQTLSHHEILAAGRSSAQYPVDITDDASVEALLRKTGKLDAIVSAAGALHFGPLSEMKPADFAIGLNDKLLGQVRLALLGQHHLFDGGSITLTTGIVSAEPIRAGANASAVNRAIEGFVAGAACELPRGLRINAVSPSVLTESMDAYGAFFPGFEPVPAARAALAYRRSVEGVQSGRTFEVW
ncbi:NAD(P)-dependent dehydrogenase, short-chain alcohol dehydrogenase family [Lysobacter sp. yr284]|uniref:short chain dehydrogenase n=1 Tax=Lysobacter sp. yr284 TaxID=1761791 RepID=UPI00089BD19C|nr:short chain dehydrogenase [Lysobacter sp. yr284]SDZ27961.1 NAD(P)-dependent dehydrogenase, short-chain alcohol dehydrogenase family [Lysobacter sp. yr284]